MDEIRRLDARITFWVAVLYCCGCVQSCGVKESLEGEISRLRLAVEQYHAQGTERVINAEATE